ncbi:MAG: hypothetical protein ACREOI_11815 [bacterium]
MLKQAALVKKVNKSWQIVKNDFQAEVLPASWLRERAKELLERLSKIMVETNLRMVVLLV